MANSIKYFTDKYDIPKDLNSVSRDFYEKIEELSKENEMELKIYNTNGKILLSLDRELNPNDSIPSSIFNHIFEAKDSFYIHQKSKTNLATYSVLKNRLGENIGILNCILRMLLQKWAPLLQNVQRKMADTNIQNSSLQSYWMKIMKS